MVIADTHGELIRLLDIPDVLRRPIPKSTLYAWVNRGVQGYQLKATRIGGRRFIRIADLEAFLSAINDGTGGQVAAA